MHLIQPHAITKQRTGFRPLLTEPRRGVLLHLVHVRVEPPVPDVAIAPLAGHFDVDVPAFVQPGGEELFGQPIGAGHVHLPDPGAVGVVEHGERRRAHRRDIAFGRQLPRSPQIDIRGPAQRSKAEHDAFHPAFPI